MSERHGRTGSVLVVGVGAERGLGAAIARRFGREGLPVVIAGRNAGKLEATTAALKGQGVEVAAIVGDAASSEDARRFVEAAQVAGPLAVAVHNAGSNRPSPFLKISEADFTAHWREHVLGGFQLAQAALPVLLDIDAIAEMYWVLHNQHRSAWTLELDLRPWAETF